MAALAFGNPNQLLYGHPNDLATRDRKHRKKHKAEVVEALERLALKGSCVKDGGEAHAMLLVPMRPEQRKLLPCSIHSPRLFAMVRRLTLRPGSLMSPALYGHDIERAMLKFQADRQLALARVASRGLALQHLPQELRDDKELVLTAVRNKGRALEFAAPRLRADVDIVLEALGAPSGQKALAFVDEKLLKDDRIKTAAERTTERAQGWMDSQVQEPKERKEPRNKSTEPSDVEVLPLTNGVFSQEMLCLLQL